MPRQDLNEHFEATASEREVLLLLALGFTNDEIATAIDSTIVAVVSRLRRFHERSGLTGRTGVAWAVHHHDCCLTVKSS